MHHGIGHMVTGGRWSGQGGGGLAQVEGIGHPHLDDPPGQEHCHCTTLQEGKFIDLPPTSSPHAHTDTTGGRYASYWKAFLLYVNLSLQLLPDISTSICDF